MALELEGKIKLMMDTQTFDSGFSKREFVVTTDEQYPQDVKFECIKDKIELLNAFEVNENVKVHFNVRGNEYNGRYYVNLQAWRLEKAGQAAPAMNEAPAPAIEDATSEEDDLPF